MKENYTQTALRLNFFGDISTNNAALIYNLLVLRTNRQKNMKKAIFLLLAVCMSVTLMAQYSNGSKDTTIRISTYNIKKKKSGSSEMNVVKLAPFGFIPGTFSAHYERVLTDFFSIQGGIGFTHRNYVRNLFWGTDGLDLINYQYPGGQDPYEDKADGIYDFDSRTPQLGFMLSIQPRLYFDSEAPDGAYFCFSYDRMRHRFDVPGIRYDSTTFNYVHRGSIKKEYEDLSDMLVGFGYQVLYDRLSLDFTGLAGLRNVSGKKYYYFDNGSTIDEGFAKYKQTLFNFNIAIKVGYHF